MMKMLNFKNALINFNNSSLLMEENIIPYLKRSICYNEMSQNERAIEELKQVIEMIDSNESQQIRKIIKICERLCKNNSLRSMIQDLLQKSRLLSHEQIILFLARYVCKYEMDYEKALRIMETKGNDQSDNFHLMQAKVMIKLKNYQQALTALNKLSDITQGNLKKAFCFYHLNDFKKVVKTLEPLPNLKDSKPNYRLILAQSLYHTSQYDKALTQINSIINITEQQSDTTFLTETLALRAKCFQKLMRFDEAVADFTRLIDIAKKSSKPDAEMFLLRALNYEAKGKVNEAQEDIKKAIEISLKGANDDA